MPGSFITSDLSKFVETSEFGIAATYTPVSPGVASTVNGIFTDGFKELNPITGNYEDKAPEFVCATSSVSSAKHDETLSISGTTYYIVGVRPDGTGMTTLLLSKEAAHG